MVPCQENVPTDAITAVNRIGGRESSSRDRAEPHPIAHGLVGTLWLGRMDAGG